MAKAGRYAASVLLAVLAGVIVAAALGYLGLAVLRTWQSVKTFTEDVSAASARMSDAAAALESGTKPAGAKHRA